MPQIILKFVKNHVKLCKEFKLFEIAVDIINQTKRQNFVTSSQLNLIFPIYFLEHFMTALTSTLL